MEAAFREHYLERMLPFVRASLGLGIALVITVSIIDMLLMPKAFFEPVVPLRLMTMLLPLVVGMGAAVFLKERNSLPYLLAGVSMVVGVSAIWIGTIATGNDSHGASWPLVYITFSAYLVLGLTFRQSVVVGWSLFVFVRCDWFGAGNPAAASRLWVTVSGGLQSGRLVGSVHVGARRARAF